MNTMALPPKMATQFAERAKNGEGDKLIGSTGSIYFFYQGRQEICLVSLDPPIGHVTRLSEAEYKAKMAERAKARELELNPPFKVDEASLFRIAQKLVEHGNLSAKLAGYKEQAASPRGPSLGDILGEALDKPRLKDVEAWLDNYTPEAIAEARRYGFLDKKTG